MFKEQRVSMTFPEGTWKRGSAFCCRRRRPRNNVGPFKSSSASFAPGDTPTQQVIVEKRRKVLQILGLFEPQLQHCLRTGQGVGPRFRDIVSKILPDSAKKAPKEAWSEADYA